MANNSALINYITSVIRSNGNQEITGDILQEVLLDIVNRLGYQFAGVATPTTEPPLYPDANIWYLASAAGTYTNFNGVVLDGNTLVAFVWNGEWTSHPLIDCNIEIDSGVSEEWVNNKLLEVLAPLIVKIDKAYNLFDIDDDGNIYVKKDENGNPRTLWNYGDIVAGGNSEGEDPSTLTTIGELVNVADNADDIYSIDKVLIKLANSTEWTLADLSSLVGLDEQALASYLTTNNYAKKSDIEEAIKQTDVTKLTTRVTTIEQTLADWFEFDTENRKLYLKKDANGNVRHFVSYGDVIAGGDSEGGSSSLTVGYQEVITSETGVIIGYLLVNDNSIPIYAPLGGGGTASNVEWANVLNKPTTLAGYGITASDSLLANYVVNSTLANYQTKITEDNKLAYTLISGTPTSLKNPNALSWSGYSSGSYDGSSAKSITIPNTTSQISEGTNLYFTNARAVSALSNTLANYVTTSTLSSTLNGYLPLSGGTITGYPAYITLHSTMSTGDSWVQFTDGETSEIYAVGIRRPTANYGFTYRENNNYYKIIHSGNIGSQSVNYATSAGSATFTSCIYESTDYNTWYNVSKATVLTSTPTYLTAWSGNSMVAVSPANINVGSADIAAYAGTAVSLATARSIWGQSFDGTGDVSGTLSSVSGINFSNADCFHLDSQGHFFPTASASWWGVRRRDGNYAVAVTAQDGVFQARFTTQLAFGSGNVLIGTTTDNGSGAKLQVNGSANFGKTIELRVSDGASARLVITEVGASVNYIHMFVDTNNSTTGRPLVLQNGYGNVGIGTSTPSSKLYVAGNIIATGEITAGSDIRYKSIQNDVHLDTRAIANAPIFDFRWTDREDNKLHLGTSAQYWLDYAPTAVTNGNDFYSLNYGVLGVAIGVSNARKLLSHEERIEQLERENKQLKEKLERYGIN